MFYSLYSPPYWHFYSLSSSSTTPCGFDSSTLYSGISVCSSVPRISVSYSSSQSNLTTLTISRASTSDAGTYTCGPRNPRDISSSHSVIVGVIGKPIYLNRRCNKRFTFLPRCIVCNAIFLIAMPSVRLSVRHTCVLWENEGKFCRHLIPHEREFHLVFWHEEWLVGDVPFYLKFWAKLLSLIHIWRCRRSTLCRSRWSPYH